MSDPLFPLGHVVITSNARDVLDQRDVDEALRRHTSGDWGDLGKEDRRANDLALVQGLRLFSAYNASSGARFWVITEHDRSATTILLPEDY